MSPSSQKQLPRGIPGAGRWLPLHHLFQQHQEAAPVGGKAVLCIFLQHRWLLCPPGTRGRRRGRDRRCLRKQTPLQGAKLDPHPEQMAEVPPGCADGRRRSSLSWHTGLLPAELFASVLMLCHLFPFFSLQLNNLGIEAFQHLIFKQTFFLFFQEMQFQHTSLAASDWWRSGLFRT